MIAGAARPRRVPGDPALGSSTQVLHGIFEAQATARPNAVAVVAGDRTITYGELDARANRLARYLLRRGAGLGASVAMMLPRSIDAYCAILAILKAGAAYVPIDPDWPSDRIAWMLEDSGASVILTAAQLAAHAAEIAEESPEALPPEACANPRDLCYVVYTSGTTGRPKGVMVEHRNASHIVRAEADIFEVRADDRVYQGAALFFDLSIEEIWLAFHAGAALVAATPEIAQAGPDLSRRLAECGVTVLSCVPTMLSMLDRDVPSVRLLILGGERCPDQLAARWVRPGRRIVNTYGPTETTVIATYADILPDKPVTIGKAVPGYDVQILDQDHRPVREGEAGEICIGGAGVARGYKGLPEETRARFIPYGNGGRIYLSGDLGRVNREGDIEFLGRADGQVKLRGMRVEPGEIEAVLMGVDNVRAAACCLRENARGDPQLVAYIVSRDGTHPDQELLFAQLRRWLPQWMVPSLIETVDDLPRLPNGKLDRAALPEPRWPARARLGTSAGSPESDTEGRLLEVWSNLFGTTGISTGNDFFLDLGGHSLLAARMVSELRKDARFASLTVRDVYRNPTIAQLALLADFSAGAPEPPRGPPDAGRNVRLKHFLAGVAQFATLYFAFGFRGAQWITPWLVYFILARHHPALESTAWAAVSSMALLPVLILTAVCAKWSLLGRIPPGRYPLWGVWYLRWWFVQTLVRSLPLGRLGGTPLLPLVYRLFGARIGKDAHVATSMLAAFDVISIGDGASVDERASLLGYTVQDGFVEIGPVCVGAHCFVGTKSVLAPDTVMEDGARLEDLSLLETGARVPAGQTWAGSPPRHIPRETVEHNRPPARSGIHRIALMVLYTALICCLPLVELMAFVPGVMILTRFNPGQLLFYLAAPLVGASFIVCLTALVVLLKWLLIGRVRAGSFPVDGWFYVRNWVVEQLLALSVDVAGPLHATLFLKPWYRALGVRLGRFAEVSTASVTTPDLLDIGEDCFIADEVSLGAARVEDGWLTLAPTRLGSRVFVGNSAVIPAGTSLGDESLVGVLTIVPSDGSLAARRGASWLGSPPVFLPCRQTTSEVAEKRTFRPSRRLQWARGCFEILRVTLPGAGFLLVTVGALETALDLWSRSGPAITLTVLPVLFAAGCISAILAVAVSKWVVMGRYEPCRQPLWSAYVWRMELVNALFEFLASPIALEVLRGTPFLPWYLRLLGVRIGRRVYLETTGFLEFDLVEIGDRSVLNTDCIVQTHLFEDRVLKTSRIRIGADCEVGAQSVVLYDTEMCDHAWLGPLVLLMKGEILLPGKVRGSKNLKH